ncbi:uncharacterized protein PADG_02256, partial [Paracoccidioides brasiliensis Pb18]
FKRDNAGCTVPANPSEFYEDARSSSSCKSPDNISTHKSQKLQVSITLKAKHQGGQNAFMRHKKFIRLPKASSGFRQHVCCVRVDDVVDRTTSAEVAGFMKSGVLILFDLCQLSQLHHLFLSTMRAFTYCDPFSAIAIS